MTKYREILRLASLGLSQQNIADSSGVSKKTVNRVLKRAKELNIVRSQRDRCRSCGEAVSIRTEAGVINKTDA